MTDDSGRVINLAAEREAGSMSRLLGKLARNQHNGILPTVHNAMLILEEDPELRDCFGYDAFRNEALLLRAPPPLDPGNPSLPGPYPRGWQLEEIVLVQAHLQKIYSHKFSRSTVEDAIIASAARHRFHRPRDWLDGLKWDGVRRLDTWLHHAVGTPDDDYHAATGSKFMIAAVRRIRHPGCKFDVMPILEGPQGIGKSELCRIMAGSEYFSDGMPAQLESKEAAIALHGHIIVELAEIQHLVRSEPETVKAFLSRAVDRYRPPYGRNFVEIPRQSVLIGTTNTYDYLRDATGNRRFWPWRCRFVDKPWLIANREQLWAEAAAREAMGEHIWLEDADVLDQAERYQDGRMEEDTWTEAVNHYITAPGRAEVSAGQVLSDGLGIPLERQDLRQKRRVTAVLRRLGWEQGERARTHAGQVRLWSKQP